MALTDNNHELKMMLDEELTNLRKWMNDGDMSPREVLESLEDLVNLYNQK